MKILIAMLLASLPAAAQAYGMEMPGGDQCGSAGVHAATALYAVLAILGYWVLQHSAKETLKYVKRSGTILGMTLVVIGLLGFLCGVRSHIKRSTSPYCATEGQMMRGMPERMRGAAPDTIIQDGQEMIRRGGRGIAPMPEVKSPPAPAKKSK